MVRVNISLNESDDEEEEELLLLCDEELDDPPTGAGFTVVTLFAHLAEAASNTSSCDQPLGYSSSMILFGLIQIDHFMVISSVSE
tara:strand:- start:215 stop:469 length:255 start_codon:yes stop_codon:yes gene_type:complete